MAKSSLQSPLIPNNERGHVLDGETSQQEDCSCSRETVFEEAKKQLWLAGPLIAVSLLQYCLQVISIMFVGHLGELALSSASMASSFASVTGFSVLVSGIFLFLFGSAYVENVFFLCVGKCLNRNHFSSVMHPFKMKVSGMNQQFSRSTQ